MNRISTSLYLFVLLLLAGACNKTAKEPVAADYGTLYLPDMEGLFNTYQRLQERQDFRALADTLLKVNQDLRASELYFQASYAYSEAGEIDSVAAMLHRAIDQGMSNPRILEKLPLDSIPEGAAWNRLRHRLDSIDSKLNQLSNFELEARSMEVFWPYFERAMADTSLARKELRAFILGGPPEVRDFYVVRYGSINQMYGQMINGAPDYYRYLKKQFNPDSLHGIRSRTLKSMQRFQQLYPQAVFPKVYIVPGILNSGGTATEMGMFLGGDMYGRSAEMPTEELTDWQRDAIMNFSDLPRLTIHELMHFQQNYRDTLNRGNLLSAVIHEGVCDFMVELCSGTPIENKNLDFLSDPANRDWILGEFHEELFGEDNSKWLYNGGSIEDRPHDLGYTVGYLISKSYYQRQQDKNQAVYQLLNTDDMTRIVRNSDYAYLLQPSPSESKEIQPSSD